MANHRDGSDLGSQTTQGPSQGPGPGGAPYARDADSHGTSSRPSGEGERPPDKLSFADGAEADPGEAWSRSVVSAVEGEIVPKLLALIGRAPVTRSIEDSLITAVADAAVAGETEVVASHVQAEVLGGASLSDALTDLIGAAARALGSDWENDRRDFMDVTIGTGTLQRVVASMTGAALQSTLPGRFILLGTTPGEHHTLGLAVLEHLFRQARWKVDYRPYAERTELLHAVEAYDYAVVGLSLSADTFIAEANETIAALRVASQNPGLRIMLGGPALMREVELGERLGADAVAVDGRVAVSIANAWASRACQTRLRR